MKESLSSTELRGFIVNWLSSQLGHSVKPEANFGALGLDSLDAVELTDALAEKLGVDELPISLILDHASPVALAEHLAANFNCEPE